MNIFKEKRGSGIILTILMIASIMVIGLSMVMISNLEARVSSKTRSSSVAYQNADTGVEFALGTLLKQKRSNIEAYDPGLSATMMESDDFSELDGDPGGAADTGENPADWDGIDDNPYDLDGEWKVYFLDKDKEIIDDLDTTIDQVEYVRSVGEGYVYGSSGEKVLRSVQVRVPNLPFEPSPNP